MRCLQLQPQPALPGPPDAAARQLLEELRREQAAMRGMMEQQAASMQHLASSAGRWCAVRALWAELDKLMCQQLAQGATVLALSCGCTSQVSSSGSRPHESPRQASVQSTTCCLRSLMHRELTRAARASGSRAQLPRPGSLPLRRR